MSNERSRPRTATERHLAQDSRTGGEIHRGSARSFFLPPGYLEYYGIRPPEEEKDSGTKPFSHPSGLPRGLLQYYGLLPSRPQTAETNTVVPSASLDERAHATPANPTPQEAAPHSPDDLAPAQLKAVPGSAPEPMAQPPSSTTGHPLPSQTRQKMEQSFGRSFSDVRVHEGSAASDLHALACTRGSEIHFASGEYQPGTPAGDALIGHELAHVVQQARGRVTSPEPRGQQVQVVSLRPLEEEADRAATAVAHGDPVPHSLSGISAPLPDAPLLPMQRFASEEHQRLGDIATGHDSYALGGKNDPFELTHGDIIALSGDLFTPDDLFKLAAIPGQKGQKVGTRDEILWALQDETIWTLRVARSGPYAGHKDPRFQPGGPYAGYIFSDAVKSAVRSRYQRLAANNTNHFAAPRGRDKNGNPIPSDVSAGSSYSSLHEFAIKLAYQAGRSGGTLQSPLAREAAAQHFLTDAFSAGHLRTPTAEIRQYWSTKYPLFWYNLRHKIALDTAIEMTRGTVLTVHKAYVEILQVMEEQSRSLPAITLGDLVALIFHDVDNAQGVRSVGGSKVFGDAHLDADTERLAITAIQAGNQDIAKAHEIGKTTTMEVPDADLFAQVRLVSSGSSDRYAAELLLPKPAPDEDAQNWKAPDIETLWDQKMLGSSGNTIGQVIAEQLQGGKLALQLVELAARFPASQAIVLRPREAYLRGFVARLANDPRAGILDMVHWAPRGMSTGDASFDSARELDQQGEQEAVGTRRENLTGMTLEQRFNYLTQILEVEDDKHRQLVLRLFTTASPDDRRILYRRLEGHDWRRDFVHQTKTSDRLYRYMSQGQVESLKNLLNE
jgi:hypothetical protein